MILQIRLCVELPRHIFYPAGWLGTPGQEDMVEMPVLPERRVKGAALSSSHEYAREIYLDSGMLLKP